MFSNLVSDTVARLPRLVVRGAALGMVAVSDAAWDLLLCLPAMLLLGAAFGLGFLGIRAVYARLCRGLGLEEEEKPAAWHITMSDPDGIPMRSDSLSADGIARLIRDINSGFYK